MDTVLARNTSTVLARNTSTVLARNTTVYREGITVDHYIASVIAGVVQT
jgi:hypothetical protein